MIPGTGLPSGLYPTPLLPSQCCLNEKMGIQWWVLNTEYKSCKQVFGLGYMVLVLPNKPTFSMSNTEEEEWQFWHRQDIDMGVDLRLGCPAPGLLAEPKGRVPEGPPQALTYKGLVHWPYGAPELEEVDGNKVSEGPR